MKRVMCIDDSKQPLHYTNDIKVVMGETYNVTNEVPCPQCKEMFYNLLGMFSPNGKSVCVCHCGDKKPNHGLLEYKASRFIDIDEYADLIEIEKTEKELI